MERDSHGPPPLHIPCSPKGLTLRSPARGTSLTIAGRMTAPRQLPDFAQADWYSDPTDHRCPHDAWLESIKISEPTEGERKGKRKTAITIRLLGAYHDGHIVFRYADIGSFAIGSPSSDRGLGDWLEDRYSVTSLGSLRHEITWCFGTDAKSFWFIEAGSISYEWIPKKGDPGGTDNFGASPLRV